MSDKIELLPCPFCGLAARMESNRDWHRIVVDHDEKCVFLEHEAVMVPATDEQLKLAVEDWNRRAALAQQPGPAAPAGYQVIPVRPTAAMLEAGQWALDHGCYPSGIWADMLAAAPTAPVAVGQEPVAHVSEESFSSNGTSDIITRNLPVGTALYTAPPAAEQPDGPDYCDGPEFEGWSERSAEQQNAAIMPCGTAVSNVHEAYEAGKKSAEQPYSTTSDQYRAELYDEVWEKARSMGYGNVTEALVALERMQAAEQPDTVKVHRELYTCVGKGGEYELLGRSLGAGERRLDRVVVYRDTETGLLYHRTLDDFDKRMALLGKEDEA